MENNIKLTPSESPVDLSLELTVVFFFIKILKKVILFSSICPLSHVQPTMKIINLHQSAVLSSTTASSSPRSHVTWFRFCTYECSSFVPWPCYMTARWCCAAAEHCRLMIFIVGGPCNLAHLLPSLPFIIFNTGVRHPPLLKCSPWNSESPLPQFAHHTLPRPPSVAALLWPLLSNNPCPTHMSLAPSMISFLARPSIGHPLSASYTFQK